MIQLIFSKFKFLSSISILDTRYKYFESQNNNLFYLFYSQVNYILAYYFADLKTIKYNIDKSFTNFLINFIINNFLYYNVNK